MNIFALGSIDYFSGGLPFILLAAWGIWVFQPVITLFHEWGRKLVAYLLTEMKFDHGGGKGENSGLKPIKIGSGFHAGYTLIMQLDLRNLLLLENGKGFSFCLVVH